MCCRCRSMSARRWSSYLRRRPADQCPGGVRDGSRAARGAHPGRGQWRRLPSVRPRRGSPVGAAPVAATAATGMLPRGASLAEIAQVLRHRDVKTTAIYATVDRARLRPRGRGREPGHDWPALRHERLSDRSPATRVRADRGRTDLERFIEFMDHAGAERVTSELALMWATIGIGASASVASAAWGRARFRSLPQHDRPSDRGSFCGSAPRPVSRASRPTSIRDAEIEALMRAARELTPRLRAATFETVIGLMAVSGLRAGEALGLDRGDVDLQRRRAARSRRQARQATRSAAARDAPSARFATTAGLRDRLLPAASDSRVLRLSTEARG